jgi:hypothetical protein
MIQVSCIPPEFGGPELFPPQAGCCGKSSFGQGLGLGSYNFEGMSQNFCAPARLETKVLPLFSGSNQFKAKAKTAHTHIPATYN